MGCVPGMWEIVNLYKILGVKHERKRPIEIPRNKLYRSGMFSVFRRLVMGSKCGFL